MSEVMGFLLHWQPAVPLCELQPVSGLGATNHSTGTNDPPLARLDSIPGCPMDSLGDPGQITLAYKAYSEE